ncbi:MAG: polysaccharide pyruvyl transferase family protein [Limosilactobacillus sp.]
MSDLKRSIGIMSMQRIFNYGSFLQAYSLKRIVNKMGYDVKFIDYHPGKPLVTANDGKLSRKLDKISKTLKLKAPLKEKIKFLNYKKKYAQNYYPLLGISEKKTYKTSDLDTLIIGSDEVFNCVQSNPNVGFSEDLFGVNSQAGNLISYAASFGNTTMDKIDQYHLKNDIGNWLNNFNAISVRDNNSARIVSNLTGETPSINLDPVLIYFSKKNLNPILQERKDPSKYLLLYGYNGRFTISECKIIKKFADSKNLKIVCIGGLQHYCDEFVDCDPFSVLNYFYHAEFVITDTFHGTIMSIINNKKFVTIIRNTGYGNSQKLNDLLNRLHLNEQKLDSIENIEMYLERNIDYNPVNKKLEEERKKATNFLKNYLTK